MGLIKKVKCYFWNMGFGVLKRSFCLWLVLIIWEFVFLLNVDIWSFFEDVLELFWVYKLKILFSYENGLFFYLGVFNVKFCY